MFHLSCKAVFHFPRSQYSKQYGRRSCTHSFSTLAVNLQQLPLPHSQPGLWVRPFSCFWNRFASSATTSQENLCSFAGQQAYAKGSKHTWSPTESWPRGPSFVISSKYLICLSDFFNYFISWLISRIFRARFFRSPSDFLCS